MTMQTLAIMLIGYSIFSSFTLLLSHFTPRRYSEQHQSQLMGIGLVIMLSSIQLLHLFYLQTNFSLHMSWLYHLLLLCIAPLFYLFSAPLLKPRQNTDKPVNLLYLIHFTPVLLVLVLPLAYIQPLSFAIGSVYMLVLAQNLYKLRAQREAFKIELVILMLLFVIAIMVLILGLSTQWITSRIFYELYASAIGGAFILASLLLAISPNLSSRVVEASRETYNHSTLLNIDCDAALKKLDKQLSEQRLFTQSNLDLATLAAQIGLSSHQLSELVNTRLGKSFSRLLREQRVCAAQQALIDEPCASVLSIGLSMGFSSQSNFYDAFREITGMTPGKYRKIHLKTPQ